MFGSEKKTVAVTFVDDRTSEPIATSSVPVEQLPDTFAIDTDLELKGESFLVVGASPETKAEFSRLGRLTVRLAKVELIGPGTILFSLPTICGSALPDTVVEPPTARTLVLHEDDWRQCEFIDLRHRDDVCAELARVRAIHANETVEAGWRQIHVRDRIDTPLPPRRTLDDLLGETSLLRTMEGIAIGEQTNSVQNAVGRWLDDDVLLWGPEVDGSLTALCVENIHAATPATVGRLMQIAERNSMVLVDWCRCRVYAAPGLVFPDAVGEPWDSAEEGDEN